MVSVAKSMLARVFETSSYFYYGRYRFNKRYKDSEWAKRPIIDLQSTDAFELTVAPKILFVVDSSSAKSWEPGTGNLMFEIVATAVEKYGDSNISKFFCSERDQKWKEKLLKQIQLENPTELFLNIEIDPDNSWKWTWDELINSLRMVWRGRLRLFLYDSVYFLHLWRLDLITRRDRNCDVISIDINCKKFYRGPAPNIGPAIIPISKESLLATQQIFNLQKKIQVSFVGALYPYREKALRQLVQKNIAIQVNPHKREKDSGSYLDYLRALGESSFTINFSRANRMNRKQMKCRMLEASITGAIVISDERKWTSKFFRPGHDYIYVRKIGEAHQKLKNLSSEEVYLLKENALARAHAVNKSII